MIKISKSRKHATSSFSHTDHSGFLYLTVEFTAWWGGLTKGSAPSSRHSRMRSCLRFCCRAVASTRAACLSDTVKSTSPKMTWKVSARCSTKAFSLHGRRLSSLPHQLRPALSPHYSDQSILVPYFPGGEFACFTGS